MQDSMVDIIYMRLDIGWLAVEYMCNQFEYIMPFISKEALQWRHNERDCVSNRRRVDYLLNVRRSKLHVTGFCEVTGGFHS